VLEDVGALAASAAAVGVVVRPAPAEGKMYLTQ
jgi:hypothetical protein